MPEPNNLPPHLRIEDEEAFQTCSECAHFEASENEDAEYGNCTAYEYLVKPNWVCDSFTDPAAVS